MRLTAALPLVTLVLVLTACASTPPPAATAGSPAQQLPKLADVLWRNARVLSIRADGIDRGFADDAHAFEEYALEFRKATSRRASDSELQSAWDELSNSYESLQADAKGIDKTQATSAMQMISGPYQNVAAAMTPTRSGL
jgi:hypothetical protein